MSQLLQKHIELHDINVPAFLKVLDKCKGNVYLMSEDGDKLNLKSKLCQIYGPSSLKAERLQRHM